MKSLIERFQQMIEGSERIVFFGGAGVSTESGIPDFRSVEGLYSQRWKYPPETILSHTFFQSRPEVFYEFYREKMICLDAEPNAAHRALAALERSGRLSAVITQNIDGLHQAAGSRRVLELHGSVHRNYCVRCHAFYGVDAIVRSQGAPLCACGGIVKPDVVLYEEALDESVLRESLEALRRADMLIVGGTSLAVYPAAGLINAYQGERLVIINRSPTPADERADLLIPASIGAVFSQVRLPESES
jgi:NAD-dependent deacetylase